MARRSSAQLREEEHCVDQFCVDPQDGLMLISCSVDNQSLQIYLHFKNSRSTILPKNCRTASPLMEQSPPKLVSSQRITWGPSSAAHYYKTPMISCADQWMIQEFYLDGLYFSSFLLLFFFIHGEKKRGGGWG